MATLAQPALAEEEPRLDHRGALGGIVAGGVAFQETVLQHGVSESGRGALVLGELTFPLGQQGNEWTVGVGTAFADRVSVALEGGIRAYFGDEAWKTFATVEGVLHVTPAVSAGPRLGFGVQWDFAQVAGAFVQVAAEVTAGQGIRYGASVAVGFQFRTYVFE
ncbi:MAG TPA: hypothetical protein VK454_06090 [Myxococcaceae bacterium]|nr:hypothetical protein [Myxococcaceae bacterium]